MPARRANPNRIKLHRSYTANELAICCGVHKNTVRHWQKQGLCPVDGNRPILFHGSAAREFLTKRNSARKRPCPPGTMYCLRCRQPRAPALDMVEYVPITAKSGNLRALCECCEALIHRRVRQPDIGKTMPGLPVQIRQDHPSLSGRTSLSLNCDLSKRG